MAGPNTLDFTDSNFETEVVQADKPVLVDFWAEWCSPCKALTPIIDELATVYNGRAKVGKLDTDTSPKTSARFSISSIPTVILFTNGEIVEKFFGLKTKEDYQTALDGVLTAG